MSTTSKNTTLMAPEAIIEAWSQYNYTFPKAAFEAAVAQREALTPHLLRLIDDVALDSGVMSGAEGFYTSSGL